MMRSLFSGVSGLKSHQTRMDVIGNNIANVNTTGFKSSRVTFADTLSQTLSGASAPQDNLGGTNPKQIGLGTGVASIDMLFTDGSVQSTGKNTDLCLSGNGLFVVRQGGKTGQPGPTYYTRDGAFAFDADGNYVLPGSGLYVQGWTATNGSLNTKGATGNIQIPSGKSMDSKATGTVTYENNLNASVASIVSMTGGTTDGSTKTHTTDGESSTASTGTPLTLTVTYPDGTTEEIVKTEGTYAVGGTQSRETNTTTGSVTSSADTNPVSVTLKNGKKYTVSTADANMKYGFTTDTPGETVTASPKQQVTLYYDNGKPTIIPKAVGLEKGPYTVGGTYQGEVVNNGQVTASQKNPLVLKLGDGTEHTVTSGTYEIGTDTYTYPGTPGTPVTATVTGASPIYTIQKMDVMTLGGGNGTTVQVGGFAEEINLPAATADANTKVIINGSVTKTTGSYKLGDTYTGDLINTPGEESDPADPPNKGILLTLADGTTATGAPNKTYKVGEAYTYTDRTGGKHDTTIASFAYTGTVNSLATRSDIAAIDYVETGKITQIEEPSQLIASSENPVTLTLSDGTSVQETKGSYQKGTSLPVTTTATIYDSLGGKHEATLFFTKMGVEKDQDGNPTSKWAVSLDLDHTASGEESTATIKDENGNLTKLTMPVGELKFNSSGAYKSGSGILELTLTNGAGTPPSADPTQPAGSKKRDTQTVSVNLLHLTQHVSGNTLVGTGDGNAAGTLSSVSIDSSGIITGTYTNGMKQTEAQVAVAQFKNASGLTKTGNSLYQESNNSGSTPTPQPASDLGVTITPSALEMSNVDIANEFSDMIITQRGFQSNSKIITVGDEMIETLINMKR